jgi:hypothetical protein
MDSKISTFVKEVVLENNEIGYAAHFTIGCQTFSLTPCETEEMAKWYEHSLIVAFNKLETNQ